MLLSKIAYFFNYRPLCLLTIMLSLFNLAFGVGFIFAPAQITQTIIYMNVAELISPIIVGVVLTFISMVSAWYAAVDRIPIARVGLLGFALFWLYGAISYALGGNYLLMIIAMMFSLIPGYISYYYKFRRIWDGPKDKYMRRVEKRPGVVR